MSPQSYSNILQMIGHTPLVAVTRLDTGPCRLFLKLENQNPGGSIKDRIGLYLIEAAEREGRLPPGGTLIEATAGNTGLGLALVAAQKGYRLLLVIPDKMSQEKIFHLKAMGAEVVLTRSDVSKGHRNTIATWPSASRARRPTPSWSTSSATPPIRARTRRPPRPRSGSRWITTSMPWSAASGPAAPSPECRDIFARTAPNVEIVLADPAGSVLPTYVKTGKMPQEHGSWLVEGIGGDYVPPVADFSRVSDQPTRFPMRKPSRPAASFWRRRASSAAPPRAR